MIHLLIKYGSPSMLKGPLPNNNKEISELEKAHQPLTKEEMEELDNG